MRNRVELLRSILFTSDDILKIKNLKEIAEFSEKDIEFMEEFKKIYELGLNQLEKFINKLDAEGSELDVYSIKYYVGLLLRSPLSGYVRTLSKDKKYFIQISDSMGMCGNNEQTPTNISLIKDTIVPRGVRIDTFNKLPPATRSVIERGMQFSENVFRDAMSSVIFVDNTLAGVDKKPAKRYSTENSGEFQYTPHGSLCVKDSDFRNVLTITNEKIFQIIEDTLGDENFRLFRDEKEFNLFDSETNTSTSTNFVLEREVTNSKGSAIVEVDLLGNEFDSFKRRESVLKIENPDKTVEYKLHTNQGQLGKQ
jgi:hypothetical protein